MEHLGLLRNTVLFKQLSLKCSRHELKPYGVQVSLIVPGSFESNMQDTKRLLTMMDKVWERGSQTARDEYGNDYISEGKYTSRYKKL